MVVVNRPQSMLYAHSQFDGIGHILTKNGHSALETHKKKFSQTIPLYIYLNISLHILFNQPLKPTIMNTTSKNFTIGTEVVRSKGDYVVGRTGIIIAIDSVNSRAQVDWYTASKSWVKFDCLESTSIPYEILPAKPTCKRTGRNYWQTYRKLA